MESFRVSGDISKFITIWNSKYSSDGFEEVTSDFRYSFISTAFQLTKSCRLDQSFPGCILYQGISRTHDEANMNGTKLNCLKEFLEPLQKRKDRHNVVEVWGRDGEREIERERRGEGRGEREKY